MNSTRVQMAEFGEDVLYLKEEGVPWADLEKRVQRLVEDKGYGFITQALQDATDPIANVIFYDAFNPLDPAIGQAQIIGLNKKLPNSAFVVVCDSSQEKNVKETIKIERMYTLPRDGSERQVGDLITRLESDKFLKKHLPQSLVLAEKDPRSYIRVLQKQGFDVKVLSGTINPEILGQFDSHKTKFAVVLIEGKHIPKLTDEVYRRFPEAAIVAVGSASDRRVAYDKGITNFWNRDRGPAPLILKNDRTRIEPGSSIQMGKCYLLVGPTCAGKSEAGYRITNNENIIFIQKYTTRKPRPGEVRGKHFQFISKDKFARFKASEKLFYSFSLDGNEYGVPMEILDLLYRGKNTIVTMTDAAPLPQMKEELNKIRSDLAVPVLFYADLSTLQKRLMLRKADISEKERRMNALEKSLEGFLKKPDLYKYAINTGISSTDEVGRILYSLLQWEHNRGSQSYVETILNSIVSADLFKKIAHQEEITLNIPSDIMFAYAEEKHIPQSYIASLQRQKVVCTSDSYGRLGIFLEPWKKSEEDIDFREASLDLIELAVGLEPRARNSSRLFLPLSVYGKSYDSLTTFNDGLLYMLGDDLTMRMSNENVYSVTFGYAKTSGKFYRAKRLNENDISFWRTFNENMRKFPFSGFDGKS